METKAIVKGAGTAIADYERMSGLTDMFLASLDIKENSKGTYRRALRQFFSWVTAEGKTNLTREDILSYKEHLRSMGLSSLTLSAYLVTVRKFFEWAEGMKFYPNIARGIKGAKRSRGFKKDSLTVPQIKNLLSNIDRTTAQGKRDFAILNLLVRTGLRTIEVSRANIEDIRQESGEAILWIQGKGRDNKDEFVLLTEESLSPIREYLNTRGMAKNQEPLFVSTSNNNRGERLTTRTLSGIVKEHLREVGLNSGRLTAHSLRHTAITLSLLGGASIQEAQALGRHSNINTTLIYAHNINRVKNAPERRIDALLA